MDRKPLPQSGELLNRRRYLVVGGTCLTLLAGCSGVNPMGGGSSGDSGESGETGGNGPGGIVIPSGFSGGTSPPIPDEDVTEVASYIGSDSSQEEAVEAFVSAAEDAGWADEGTGAVLGGQYSGAMFEKGDEVMIIHTQEMEGNVMVTIIVGNKDGLSGDDEDTSDDTTEETTTEERTPSQSDVDGEDHPDAPRYPGSVRTEYQHAVAEGEEFTKNKYLAEATVDEVGTFYEEESLPDNGWTIVGTEIINGEHRLIAGKDDMKLEMTWEEDDYYEGYVEIHIEVLQPAESE